MEAVRGQKHPLEAKKSIKELIYQKKYLIKFSQQPQKPLSGSNKIWATTSIKPKPPIAREAPKKPTKQDS